MSSQRSEKSVQDDKVSIEEVLEELNIVNYQPLNLQLDTGDEYVNVRQKWWQLWLPKDPPPPAPPSLEDAALTPLANASIFSQLTYTWITGIMVLGYQRTLQASDLYKMDTSQESAVLAAKLEAAWQRRVKAAADWNARLESGELRPSFFKRTGWALRAIPSRGQIQGATWSERRAAFQKHWRECEGRKEASLAWALNDVFFTQVIGDLGQIMAPLVLREIVIFAEERSAAIVAGEPTPNAGRGIAMAIGLFALTVIASVCTHQFFWRSMLTGVLVRAALITCIYERGVNLTGKARVKLSNAALVNHISTDVSRIDACAQWFIDLLATSMQIIVCLITLLTMLGQSALAGFSLFIIFFPFQSRLMAQHRRMRLRSMKWTDQRAKALLEAPCEWLSISAMRFPSFKGSSSFESKNCVVSDRFFTQVRRSWRSLCRPAVLASTLAFVTYTLITPKFNVAVLFSSLSLFRILQQPMVLMPRALSSIPDASSAIQRLTHIFYAELMSEDALVIDKDQEPALLVKDATFEWESFEKDSGEAVSSKKGGVGSSGKDKSTKEDKVKDKPAPGQHAPLFRVKNVTMTIPRGQLVAVVGPIGSGKSSLLQGLIGEMRKVSGHVSFGGRVGYCPQTAWIQNATLVSCVALKKFIHLTFYSSVIISFLVALSRKIDIGAVLETACLLPDIQLLPDGDLTEKRAINLSGGQKQRVNIARALYFQPDIVIFDDPLSAVDAHVGKSLFQDAILGALCNRGVTVILVTHAIHFLPQVDYIYTMNNGVITESGTYEELISHGGDFARLDLEFGGHASEGKDDVQAEKVTPQTGVTIEDVKLKSERAREKATGSGKLEGRLMSKEKRIDGLCVLESFTVYWTYLVAGRGLITGPVVLLFVIGMQASQILNSYTLVWWESNKFDRPTSFYQTLYGCLGVSQTVSQFLLGATMDFMAFYVSQSLYHKSLRNVFYAPMSFFDTTPMGRILSVLGKDIDNVDNQLGIAMKLGVISLATLMGSVIIITILEPYFAIALVFIAIGFNYFAAFYRGSAREVKRLESMLRSIMYAHFSETLTGLPTIRSYGDMKRFIVANRYYIDLEDRALSLVATNQRQVVLYLFRGGLGLFPSLRWLALRLDFMGSLLVLVVALLAVNDVSGINAAQIGLVLTYTSGSPYVATTVYIVKLFTADVENHMNAVERVVQYVDEDAIPREAPHEIEERKPPAKWPEHGAIKFNNVKMAYRPGLPNVLKGISVNVRGGEKIGVVGRTGAGKSSLMLALLRIVELSGGSITIDGIDISTIGLKDLRSKISIIPQDPLLFSGTIRSNLDPFSQHNDAELWDALHRSYLADSGTDSNLADGIRGEQTSTSRHRLDSTVESEGANLSVGERSLLSLARALVKDSKIVVLDEATASVDLETDNKIQHTIQTQFKDHTLLCIAHRLRTIISYDRILVIDAGLVAEFDTPSNLFKMEGGIFRGMCQSGNISLRDIETDRPVDFVEVDLGSSIWTKVVQGSHTGDVNFVIGNIQAIVWMEWCEANKYELRIHINPKVLSHISIVPAPAKDA
ncbi:ABC protein [Suillus paluster]|uniref:ABC protein n=1 Tax=Suillus paluster TaxID=48578 RepID=UPI001B87C36C|nr:ABC protein [Suillus paluster]KAG1747129.1 ABC protein [Suillus paluster]